MSIGSASRRGSCLDGQGSSRQTVAMVTDDPQHKAQVRDALTGAFGDEAYNYNGNGGCKSVLIIFFFSHKMYPHLIIFQG